MFRLSREVRFAINVEQDDQLGRRPSNSYGGFPALTGLGRYYVIQATLAGELDSATGYLRNIKDIDQRVRQDAIPHLIAAIDAGRNDAGVVLELFDKLRHRWGQGVELDRLVLRLTPLMSLSVSAREFPMIRLSQKFEFCASHRLHNPELSDEENRARFGKCNNPHGHGHNYELEVTVESGADHSQLLRRVPEMERAVTATVIDRFDHKNLNVEVAEFRDLIPSVENIAKVIYRLLKPALSGESVRLSAVRVWETPKTWCEYSE